jgi:MFS family permease
VHGLASSLLPLQQKGYRLLWLSSLTWYCGRWMDVIVTSWATLQITDSAFAVAFIGVCRSVPVMLFGAFAGAIVDRVDRRHLVLATTVTNSLATLSLGVLAICGRLEFWHVAAANLLLGLAWSIEWPSRRAMTPDLAGKALLLPAIVLDTISSNLNRVLGPLIAGIVLATLSIGGCFLVLALLYGAGIVPLLLLRLPPILKPARTATLRFILEGVGYCYRYPIVRGVLLVTVVMNACFFPYSQLLSVVARDVLRVGPVELGILASADGVGSLVGALLMLSSERFRRQGAVFVLGSASMCFCLLAFAASPVYLLSLLCLLLSGVGHAAFGTYQSTIILGEVGDALRARVMGVLTVAIGSSPIGMLFMGAVAGAVGAPWALGSSGAIGALLVGVSVALAPSLLSYRLPRPHRIPPLPGTNPQEGRQPT